MKQTKLTPKYQTTVPAEVRRFLGIGAGNEVEWHVVRGIVVVDAAKEIKAPVRFLTSQIKPLALDAVKLVHEAREGFA